MHRYILLILNTFFITSTFFTKESIAPYILDGSLVLYSPKISSAVNTWRCVLEKFKKDDYENTLSRYQILIEQRMSVNIFDEKGASALGLDYNGPLAYVNLKPGVSYVVFTIKNKSLLQSVLNNLSEPIIHRIEGEYVIFSAAVEILEYDNFKGIDKLAEFNSIKKILNLNWNKNLVWLDSSYFSYRNIKNRSLAVMGDRIIGTFDYYGNSLVLDFFTLYNNPQVNMHLKKSMNVSKVQDLSALDYESGSPAMVGQIYVNILDFLKMIQSVDDADQLSIGALKKLLSDNNIDIDEKIIPLLKSRVSYVVRNFDLLSNNIKFTISADIDNKKMLTDNIKESVRVLNAKGVKTLYKNLFTQQFYGWDLGKFKIWIGIVENQFVISSDEDNLFKFVDNIYQAKKGFVDTLPSSFRGWMKNRSVGGQMIVANPNFSRNIRLLNILWDYDMLLSLKNIGWNFYLIEKDGVIGRRDVIILNFYN